MDDTVDYGERGNALTHIHEGMTVYDAQEKKIGKVEMVYFGSSGVEEPGEATAPVASDDPRDIQPGDSWVNRLADALALEPEAEMPESLAERLLQHGFIRVDSSSLFGSDRYVFAEQIESVSDEGVRLNINADDLIKT